ncbi:MAG: hypothetical protein FOGNACKC_00838 [Anaerolineae bacterium]|nr:hypothetical protein [Anaerolineae bacterium]
MQATLDEALETQQIGALLDELNIEVVTVAPQSPLDKIIRYQAVAGAWTEIDDITRNVHEYAVYREPVPNRHFPHRMAGIHCMVVTGGIHGNFAVDMEWEIPDLCRRQSGRIFRSHPSFTAAKLEALQMIKDTRQRIYAYLASPVEDLYSYTIKILATGREFGRQGVCREVVNMYLSQSGMSGSPREFTLWSDTKPDKPFFVLTKANGQMWASEAMTGEELAAEIERTKQAWARTCTPCEVTTHRFGQPIIIEFTSTPN